MVVPDFVGLLEDFLHVVFVVAAAEILMEKRAAFVKTTVNCKKG